MTSLGIVSKRFVFLMRILRLGRRLVSLAVHHLVLLRLEQVLERILLDLVRLVRSSHSLNRSYNLHILCNIVTKRVSEWKAKLTFSSYYFCCLSE